MDHVLFAKSLVGCLKMVKGQAGDRLLYRSLQRFLELAEAKIVGSKFAALQSCSEQGEVS
jgi:hypothetical protein